MRRSLDDFQLIESANAATVGSFGSVSHVREKGAPYREYALKQIPFKTLDDVALISSEIHNLRVLEHPNIVSYGGMFVRESSVYLLMEYCTHSDLHRFIEQNPFQLEWPLEFELVCSWAQMICSALAFVHSFDILHRDIKPSNIFLTSNDVGAGAVHLRGLSVKVGDFGLSTQLSRSHDAKRAGTMLYWPPEVMEGRAPTKSADVYAAGCVLFELCMGRGIVAIALLVTEKRSALLPRFNAEYPALAELVETMLDHAAEKRPSFEECLQFIKSIFAV